MSTFLKPVLSIMIFVVVVVSGKNKIRIKIIQMNQSIMHANHRCAKS